MHAGITFITCMYLKLPKPRLCCRVCANISYFRMSLSLTERRANRIASSKWSFLISGTGSKSSSCTEQHYEGFMYSTIHFVCVPSPKAAGYKLHNRPLGKFSIFHITFPYQAHIASYCFKNWNSLCVSLLDTLDQHFFG